LTILSELCDYSRSEKSRILQDFMALGGTERKWSEPIRNEQVSGSSPLVGSLFCSILQQFFEIDSGNLFNLFTS
jgi:hypothetical protein